MPLMSIFNVSGSGMSAQSVRLNTTASNLANAESVSSSINETYKARHPVFAPMVKHFADMEAGVGVNVMGIIESKAPLQMEYAPNHPMADEKGYIYKPNVNVVEEMANMISASRSYQTNVEVMNTSKQLALRTLNLGQ